MTWLHLKVHYCVMWQVVYYHYFLVESPCLLVYMHVEYCGYTQGIIWTNCTSCKIDSICKDPKWTCSVFFVVLAAHVLVLMQCISLLQFDGPKPLHIAALTGKVDILRLLITECGCKADLEDEVGSRLSMMCLSRLQFSIVKLLTVVQKVSTKIIFMVTTPIIPLRFAWK